jgi:hypothetical protein
MTGTQTPKASRLMLAAVLGLSLLVFAVHLLTLRPRMWPAGFGVTLSGDTVTAIAAEPRAVARIRPPDVSAVTGTPLTITRVAANSEAERRGLIAGLTAGEFPRDPAAVLDLWAANYRWRDDLEITVPGHVQPATIPLALRPVWQLDADTRAAWSRQHLGPLLQMGAFLAGAFILVALGVRGATATLVTLALVATAVANGGPMLGAEYAVPLIGNVLLLFEWLVTPLSFPVIGLAVLYFPSRAPLLERHRWILGALAALPIPMLVVSITAAAFLLGVGGARAPLAWLATRGWIFDASFAAALAANVLIVIEGIHRYRTNLDANERRRIQIVVYTGVPAVFAYAIKAGVPLLSSLAGRPTELPWLIEMLLQAIVLLPAFGLPYAVAVKRVFSPRTVLRRSLQYALARRTLSVIVFVPIAALAYSLLSQRERPLGEIIYGQPLFYVVTVALIALGWRYRDQAQRWLDQRFFRAEYDAREILVALANRVPLENDPAQLVALVVSRIDTALHPESIAMLAGDNSRLEVLSAVRADVAPLPRSGGLATLLHWSDEPLEVFLDDERSPATRLPAADRAWLAQSGVTLLVPIFGGAEDPTPDAQRDQNAGVASRPLVGIIALGGKRSEEPYTAEDRRLLSGIAGQMSVALDLSRLRRQASDPAASPQAFGSPPVIPTMASATTPTVASSLLMCRGCQRCYDARRVTASADGTRNCPDDGTPLQPVIGMPPLVDGKYRVDAIVGRGGMGAVFRARDLRLERDVAIKVVRADLVADANARERFRREAQIVARLQHPAIAMIFDYGALPDGPAFLVMEYVRGEDLRRLLKRERTLAAGRAASLIAGIATGIDAAHAAGVLHRDLKPENILLSTTGPKVLDFGVAKISDAAASDPQTLTAAATIVGTPAYMAPEQLRGGAVDQRADVYSLAVMTYELITGALPFGVGSLIDVGIKQAAGVHKVETHGLTPPLADVVLRGLALQREQRPASAGAFATELQNAI